jgi:hypothetical protein
MEVNPNIGEGGAECFEQKTKRCGASDRYIGLGISVAEAL